jgi:hypothetical protein
MLSTVRDEKTRKTFLTYINQEKASKIYTRQATDTLSIRLLFVHTLKTIMNINYS